VATGRVTDARAERHHQDFLAFLKQVTAAYPRRQLRVVVDNCATHKHPALRRGTFPTADDLITAIERFIDTWKDRCTPFTWTKDPDTSSRRQPPHGGPGHKPHQMRTTRCRRGTAEVQPDA
jgi:hypothetical protein